MLPLFAKFASSHRFSPTTMPKSDILTILEVAAYLKVAERTVYRLAAARKLPAFKVGGAWRFSRADIDSWIKLQSSGAITGSLEQPHAIGARRSRGGRK
jgi:excisionase family DNA binding protein